MIAGATGNIFFAREGAGLRRHIVAAGDGEGRGRAAAGGEGEGGVEGHGEALLGGGLAEGGGA